MKKSILFLFMMISSVVLAQNPKSEKVKNPFNYKYCAKNKHRIHKYIFHLNINGSRKKYGEKS